MRLTTARSEEPRQKRWLSSFGPCPRTLAHSSTACTLRQYSTDRTAVPRVRYDSTAQQYGAYAISQYGAYASSVPHSEIKHKTPQDWYKLLRKRGEFGLMWEGKAECRRERWKRWTRHGEIKYKTSHFWYKLCGEGRVMELIGKGKSGSEESDGKRGFGMAKSNAKRHIPSANCTEK
eukprot:787709-Rhodomonas_salina.1